MPMWCPSDHSHEQGGETSDGQVLNSRLDRSWSSRPCGHHRVVRISPGDSVVLNSAEKAPYLIHVEILENDLDFDPEKRANRELLKKIVTQEERKKRKRQGIEDEIPAPSGGWSFGSPMPEPLPRTPSTANRSARKSSAPDGQRPRLGPRRQSSQSSQPTNGDVPEEVDLVEQLFGSNFSVRNEPPDLSDSIPLSLVPKNKQLDAMVWSRADGDSPVISRQSSSPGATLESPRIQTPVPPNSVEGAVSPLASPPVDDISPS
jgi:phosphatidylinositol 4-kinase B